MGESHVARSCDGHLEDEVLPLAQNQKTSKEVNICVKTKQPTNDYNFSIEGKKEKFKKNLVLDLQK